jgi:ParB-like chromosome segregation protein Spo0J
MTEFQGGLKTRAENDYKKIQSSIRKYGIAFPFFVWRDGDHNYVLDGHGRLGALQRLEQAGEEIPALPAIYIEADDAIHAKNLLLRLNSRYGEITADGIKEFLSDVDADLEGVNIPELPDIGAVLDAALANAPEYEPPKPKFELFCPECGEQQDITDDELQGAIE